jgi:DNA invertase Pin-like site-specific DNA recombinase
VATGATTVRQGLAPALGYVRPGDVFVVWRLDRLDRWLKHLIGLVEQLQARGVGLRSQREQIDTTTAGG